MNAKGHEAGTGAAPGCARDGHPPLRSVTSRISTILTTFAGASGWTMTEVAQRACLPVSTAHRLMGELVACGLLHRGADGRYHVGTALRRVVGDPGSSADVRVQIGETLEDLEAVTGHRARFATLRGHGVSYLEHAVGPRLLLAPAPSLAPAHATAAGKVLLAHAGRDVVERVVRRGLARYTSRTIVTADRLEQALSIVLERGVAVTRGEWKESHSAVAAPVVAQGGRLFGALELTVPGSPGVLRVAAPALVLSARGMARRLVESSWAAGDDPRSAAAADIARRTHRIRPRIPAPIWQGHVNAH